MSSIIVVGILMVSLAVLGENMLREMEDKDD